MEWTKREDRVAIIALHRCGFSNARIHTTLKPLKINLRFVQRTVKRYQETCDVEDRRRSGRPRSARTKAAVHAVRERINRNPLRKQKLLAKQMNIAPRTMSRILRADLGIRAYKRYTRHLLTDKLKQIRLERSRTMLKKYGRRGYRDMLFTDEKIFTIEEAFNKQNDRVYARSSVEAREKVPAVQRGHHPAHVMVWLGVHWQKGFTKVHFCDKGVKTDGKVYRKMLEDVVLPLNEKMFGGARWIFQQDSAPAHKAKLTQSWLRDNVPAFIAAEDWPSGSPDLNVLDYDLWDRIEKIACHKRHYTIESLKKSIVSAVKKIDISTIREAIDQFPDRLRKCIAAKGGHFE